MQQEIQRQRSRLRPAAERALPAAAPGGNGNGTGNGNGNGGVFSEMQGSHLLLRSRLEARREEIVGEERTMGENTGQWEDSWQTFS